MIIKYTPYFLEDFTAVEYSPRLPVVFTNPKTKMEIRPFGLVDSGAGETMLNVRLAKSLGIRDVESGEKALYGGVGGGVVGYKHALKMRTMWDPKEYDMVCSFADIADMDCLLGQNGFFENFKVMFEKYNNQFEVIEKANA
jgi:hypothetical protein